MRDRKNALIWALGWWFLRRAIRRRAQSAARGGGIRKLGLALMLSALGAGAFVAWRKFGSAGGESGGGAPRASRAEPDPRSPAQV